MRGALLLISPPTSSILLVSRFCPSRAHAGGLRILDIYALIKERLPGVQLDLYTCHRPDIDGNIDEIHKIFDRVYLSPHEKLSPKGLSALRTDARVYDIVDIQFHQFGLDFSGFSRLAKTVLFTPMESKALALLTSLKTIFRPGGTLKLRTYSANLYYAYQEIRCCFRVDKVVCVSDSDGAFLELVTRLKNILVLETGVSAFEFGDVLNDVYASDIDPEGKQMEAVYVASFGADVNITALHWYLDFVHPKVKAAVPGYRLSVVGRGDMTTFLKYADASVNLIGEVPSIAPNIVQARLGIVPAVWGAGFRGKVNQYAILGLPCVASPIAVQGLAYEDRANIFVAAAPDLFARGCVQLLTDPALNARMGAAARELSLERYTWSSKWETIRQIYDLRAVA